MKYKLLFITLALVLLFWIYEHKNELVPQQEEPSPAYLGIKASGGQLGNQMFDIAAGLAYAWDHQLTPIFIDFDGKDNNLSQNRQKVFFRIDLHKKSPIPLAPYIVANPGFVSLPDNLRNVLLQGGFFSWKYFDHHREEIIALFAPSHQILDQLQKKYPLLIASDKTVSIHVRTFSKKIHEEGCHFVGLDFFEEAMNQFPNDSIFVVFSDRIKWTEAKFKERFPEKNLVFIDGDYIEDLYLMSMMKHHILSRSTFSWWGAYLNQHPEKIVYVPIIKEEGLKGLFKPIGKKILTFFGMIFWWDENYWLPEWKKIYYRVQPYPEDIYEFGGETTSVYPLDK